MIEGELFREFYIDAYIRDSVYQGRLTGQGPEAIYPVIFTTVLHNDN